MAISRMVVVRLHVDVRDGFGDWLVRVEWPADK
jgi:hypothetical protein